MFSATMLSQVIRFYGNAMQGMMGDYLEKNIQAFVEIQNSLQEQSRRLVDSKGGAFPSADAWTQFIQGQAPMMQNLMSNYIDQSKNVFMQMQEQMQKNTQSMFQGFPFPGAKTDDTKRE
jgi:polyhydroxyalkanoate synthesis regulator protein